MITSLIHDQQQNHIKTGNWFSLSREGSGQLKNSSGLSARAIRLQISPLYGQEWLLVSECPSLNLISQIFTLATTTRIYVKLSGTVPYSIPVGVIICTGFPSNSSALILEFVLNLLIFLPISKCQNPTICSQFCPLPLSVPETSMGVTLNAQQHSDSQYVKAIHRWEMAVCWGEHCVLLLAILIYWQGTRKPTAAQAAGTLWFTSS